MGIHLAHNIRIRLTGLLFFFFVCPDFAPLNLLFFSMYFCDKWAWGPADNATPSNFLVAKSWGSDLSFDVSFVSVLAMVLSEYWKRLEEILEIRLFPHFLNMAKIIKMFPPAFFSILKEPILVQKQTIHQQKGLDLSFLETESLRAWHYQEDATPSRREKHRCAWGKKKYFTASHRQALLIIPRPLSGCHIKAEIRGFLLM